MKNWSRNEKYFERETWTNKGRALERKNKRKRSDFYFQRAHRSWTTSLHWKVFAHYDTGQSFPTGFSNNVPWAVEEKKKAKS